jgi:hypothetical protein
MVYCTYVTQVVSQRDAFFAKHASERLVVTSITGDVDNLLDTCDACPDLIFLFIFHQQKKLIIVQKRLATNPFVRAPSCPPSFKSLLQKGHTLSHHDPGPVGV